MRLPAFWRGGDLPFRGLAWQLILLSSYTQLRATGTDGVDSDQPHAYRLPSLTFQNKPLHQSLRNIFPLMQVGLC